MEKIRHINSLIVKQKKEWGEILTGFETKNRYEIFDENGNPVYSAGEKGNALLRILLKFLRPYEMHIMDENGKSVIVGKKPFKFYFHEMSVFGPDGEYLGKIRRDFALFSREFTVLDSNNLEIYKIHGPFFHPWTFQIMENGEKTGLITKKWSGLGKEMFTDADTFGINFPGQAEESRKALLLEALFMIDMLYFEQK